MTIWLGSDRLLETDRLTGTRVGVVSNPASIDASFRHVADRVQAHSGATLAALFGPQHGFRADVQDNMIETDHAVDRPRGVPVFSLYTEIREPLGTMLAEVDVLVIDLQDVGTRVYTYIYTMANCLRACRAVGLPVIVCDRPNPIGGVTVEGPLLDEAFTSFVGQFPIPLRHGMTIGELALLFNDHFGIGARLEVVPMEGWRRSMYHDATGLPWVMPSPNIPTLETAVVYPGTVLFEGTGLSEGRGTTRPFELLGAPWVEPERCAALANGAGLPGVHFPARGIRPDLPQACGRDVRGLPDPRHRPGGVPCGRVGGHPDGRVAARIARSLRLAGASVRVRAHQTPHRHPGRLGGVPVADRGRWLGARNGTELAALRRRIPGDPREAPAVLRSRRRSAPPPPDYAREVARARRIWSAWSCAWAA